MSLQLVVDLELKAQRLVALLVVDDVHLLRKVLGHWCERRSTRRLNLKDHVLLGRNLHANVRDLRLSLVHHDGSDRVIIRSHHISAKVEAKFDG